MKELTLKEIQNESLKVLIKLKEICEENDLTYFLAYGTLIGAIRHKGFIPWDDDIDVWMPRRDYEKFVQYCIDNKDNIKPFELKHYRTCKEYIYPIARLSDSRYKIDYKDAKDYGLGLFVDVYPLDGVELKDEKFNKKLKKLVRNVSMLGADNYVASAKRWKNLFKYPYYLLIRHKNLNAMLARLDFLAQKYDFDKSEIIRCNVWELKDSFDKRNLSNAIKVSFEDNEFNAPEGYDNILKRKYGDYLKLPPKGERVAHHYYSAYRK